MGFVKKFMRIDEAANVLDVHPRTVQRWIESGTTCLEVVQLSPRTRRITAESLRQFSTPAREREQN